MSFFEFFMLVCFGISWPVSIAKSIRTKIVIGKSPLFMTLLCLGYISGIIHKLVFSIDWIISLYAINLIMVVIDLILYFKYLPKKERK